MNAKQIFAATSLIALTTSAAFAADATTSTKTRAEVVAELAQARAAGEQVGGQEFAWFVAPKSTTATASTTKDQAESKLETAKAAKAKTSTTE